MQFVNGYPEFHFHGQLFFPHSTAVSEKAVTSAEDQRRAWFVPFGKGSPPLLPIQQTETKLEARIQQTKTDLEARVQQLEITMIKWMIGLIGAAMAVGIAVFRLMR